MYYYDTALSFDSATLLSSDEAQIFLTPEDRKYHRIWWLKTPAGYSKTTCYVQKDGSVNHKGTSVFTHFNVRPALIIDNLGNFRVGDVFSIGWWIFKIISPNLAWLYWQDIGETWFGNDNDYSTSNVQNTVNRWYEGLTEEMLK